MRTGPHATVHAGTCRSFGGPPPAGTSIASGAESQAEWTNMICVPSGDQLAESSNVQSGGDVRVVAAVPSTPIVRSASGQPLQLKPAYCDSPNATRVRSGEMLGFT
ncbi:MAG: hypothetical protein E6F98_09710 [Actinobacteria bacterium]|nr:MAG: hypothetical protein E6F98_09710 [Actinomycetota bacterium]